MNSNWIESYAVTKDENTTIVSGNFSASGGKFTISYEGDGGNADTYEITLYGNQYNTIDDQPTTLVVTGSWEMREVIEMFKLIDRLGL